MQYSRRRIVGAGLGLASTQLLRPWYARAADIRFTSNPFTLGVASGYPEATAVVLWTRLALEPRAPGGGMPAAAVEVEWEVATDDAFRQIARRGSVYATPDWAHSVHVEATELMPSRDYWYRFTSGGERSIVGRTRTAAPRGEMPAEFKLAVTCCQHYEQGHYAGYRAMAEENLDLVVHVGDYIYEGRGTSVVRSHDAPEAVTLDDYRERYAIYKSDPHLQAAHAAGPWMLTADDHEVANDYAGLHLGDFEPALVLARRAAAYQAYYEHLPLPRRLVPSGGRQRLYTQRSFGDLVTLCMLDGRQYRSLQACGGGDAAPCPELFAGQRTMLGAAQEEWLVATLGTSGTRWNLLGQQTLFAHFDQGDGDEHRYRVDSWNGYPAARARLVDFLATRRAANPVILSGDIHAFLVNDVNARADDLGSPIVATELVATSISSQGPRQQGFDSWRPKNPNVHLARSDQRGYLRLDVRPDRLHADLIGVDDVTRADSPTHVLASFDVADGTPGVVR